MLHALFLQKKGLAREMGRSENGVGEISFTRGREEAPRVGWGMFGRTTVG